MSAQPTCMSYTMPALVGNHPAAGATESAGAQDDLNYTLAWLLSSYTLGNGAGVLTQRDLACTTWLT